MIEILFWVFLACLVISKVLEFGVKVLDRLILRDLRQQNKDLEELRDMVCEDFEVAEEDVFIYPELLNGIENNDLYEIHYDENRRVYQIRVRNKIGGMEN